MSSTEKARGTDRLNFSLAVICFVAIAILQIVKLSQMGAAQDIANWRIEKLLVWLPWRFALNVATFLTAVVFWLKGNKGTFVLFSIVFLLALVLLGIAHFIINRWMAARLMLPTFVPLVVVALFIRIRRFDKQEINYSQLVTAGLIVLYVSQFGELARLFEIF